MPSRHLSGGRNRTRDLLLPLRLALALARRLARGLALAALPLPALELLPLPVERRALVGERVPLLLELLRIGQRKRRLVAVARLGRLLVLEVQLPLVRGRLLVRLLARSLEGVPQLCNLAVALVQAAAQHDGLLRDGVDDGRSIGGRRPGGRLVHCRRF